jgi:hypothetical protein
VFPPFTVTDITGTDAPRGADDERAVPFLNAMSSVLGVFPVSDNVCYHVDKSESAYNARITQCMANNARVSRMPSRDGRTTLDDDMNPIQFPDEAYTDPVAPSLAGFSERIILSGRGIHGSNRALFGRVQ